MTSAEERRSEDRRRRTDRQREKRRNERICGYCEEKADGGLIEWAGRGKPLRIPICRDCRGRLDGDWRQTGSMGAWCPVDEDRPCADCAIKPKLPKPKLGLIRRLFSD